MGIAAGTIAAAGIAAGICPTETTAIGTTEARTELESAIAVMNMTAAGK
jgi:hypothetical protein